VGPETPPIPSLPVATPLTVGDPERTSGLPVGLLWSAEQLHLITICYQKLLNISRAKQISEASSEASYSVNLDVYID
jgi:hypothetical protein